MNIVFLSVDCLRADHLSCYGYDRPTSPNIDSFAETATVYKNSYSNCPGTRWAFQSLHTGAPTIRFDGLGIPEDYPSLSRLLQKHGYATGGFAVNGFVSRDYNYHHGFDSFYSVREATKEGSLINQVGRKIDRKLDNNWLRSSLLKPAYKSYRHVSIGASGGYTPDHTDADTVSKALQFIKEKQSNNEEFFCWVHFMDAHTPYGYWPEHLQAIRGDTDIEHTIHPGEEKLVAEGHEPDPSVIDTYDACIRRVDEQIQRILSVLSDETAVVLTGDHGEEFGKFGNFHEASIYSSFTQVPLIIRSGSIPKVQISTPVQHIDIPATLVEMAGGKQPVQFEGESLLELDRDIAYPIFFSLSEDCLGVRAGEWKYIECSGSNELYKTPHMSVDNVPLEDEAKRSDLAALIDDYREQGHQMNGGLRDQQELSEAVRNNLDELGYL